MKIEALFLIGETVYLKTDAEQLERIVIGYYVREGGVMYEVCYSDAEPTKHYHFEISKEKDIGKM